MNFILQNPALVFSLLLQHLAVTGAALLISSVISLPLGVYIAGRPRLARLVLGFLGVIYTIPSIALIILLLPLFGLGPGGVIAALVLYTQVILVRNLVAGIHGVPAAILEAADGMGMSQQQRWRRVEVPLALPVILAGFRIAALTAIAIATIGAKFGAGGLGILLFEGIAQAGRYDKIWAGAITVAVLALLFNRLMLSLESKAQAWRKT